MSIRVLVAADVCFYREGLATFLERHPTIMVVGTAVSRPDTIEKTIQHRPDVLLLDMTMADSLSTVRAIGPLDPPVRVVALAVWENERDVIACAEAGVAGYVPREGSLNDLLRAIECVARDEMIVSPRIAASLFRRVATLASAAPAGLPIVDLTTREREIVQLIGEGLSNKQIAARLGVEVATAKNHVHNILDKLQIHRRGQISERLRFAPRLPADSVGRRAGAVGVDPV
jgi:two-component system, NarL family, nitrate/nitrite response regulator NarL